MSNLNSFSGLISNKPIISGKRHPVEPSNDEYLNPYCFIVLVNERKHNELDIEWIKVEGSDLTMAIDEFVLFFNDKDGTWQPYATIACDEPDRGHWNMIGPSPIDKPYSIAVRALKNGVYITDFNVSCPNQVPPCV